LIALFMAAATVAGTPDTSGSLRLTVQVESEADDVTVWVVTVGHTGSAVGDGIEADGVLAVEAGVDVAPLADGVAPLLPHAAAASAAVSTMPTRSGQLGRRP
jgi:hypothetical protein